MVYLLNQQDDLIIYVVTGRVLGYRQYVADVARHGEPFVNPRKQARKRIACRLVIWQRTLMQTICTYGLPPKSSRSPYNLCIKK